MIANEQMPAAVNTEFLNMGIDTFLSGEDLETSSVSGQADRTLISATRSPFIDIVNALESQIGTPHLYAGGAGGIMVRWQRGGRALTVAEGEYGVQMSLQMTKSLEAFESAVFSAGVGGELGQAPTYLDLPYLWQIQRGPHREAPAVPPTDDWEQLEQALHVLLHAWAEQMPTLFNAGWCQVAAFNLTNHADDDRVLGVLQSHEDGLALFLRDLPGRRSPSDAQDMIARGWKEIIPVLRAWMVSFEPSPESAATASGIIVRELKAGGAATPLDVSATDLSRTKKIRLTLPGIPLGMP
ncbi:hypothetical protein [Streptomyces sp. NPDC055749]